MILLAAAGSPVIGGPAVAPSTGLTHAALLLAAAGLVGFAAVLARLPRAGPGPTRTLGRAINPVRAYRRTSGRLAGRIRHGLIACGAFVTGVALVGTRARDLPVSVIAGLGLALAILAALRRLDARNPATRPNPRLALSLDLAAAALAAGHPVPTAITLAAPAAGPGNAEQLREVAALLRLGADPVSAWSVVAGDPILTRIGRDAVRSSNSGVRLAEGWERLARELRAEHRAASLAEAHRAGVWAMAPLGLCFLPAFVCLGVVPVIITLARTAFAGLGG